MRIAVNEWSEPLGTHFKMTGEAPESSFQSEVALLNVDEELVERADEL